MNPVVHFELPYKDAERITAFYHNVFGWKLTPLGEESGNYILATTAESDAKPGFPAGSINGGLFKTDPNSSNLYPSIVIGVGNLLAITELIYQYGGKVVDKPIEIPNFGLYVSFIDTEGNRNSIIQPSKM